jgi:hypothetical protein
MSSKIVDKSLDGWKKAIDHYEAELEQLKCREKQLVAAISTFRANLKRGVPWPGEQQRDETATQL